jgi:DNA-binding NarL/FixJ family response regulator
MSTSTSQPIRAQRQGTTVHIIVADDAPLIHEALRSVISRTRSFAISGFALTLGDAAQQVTTHWPHIVVCETAIAGESGLDLCRWIRRTAPLTRVAMLSHQDDPALAELAIAAGASAYLLKRTPPEELLGRLRDVMRGLTILDHRLGSTRMPDTRVEVDRFGLSPREREVLAALTVGFDNRMIAQRLHITNDTVKSHVKSILRKLRARDRTHAVAISLGMAPCAATSELIRSRDTLGRGSAGG